MSGFREEAPSVRAGRIVTGSSDFSGEFGQL